VKYLEAVDDHEVYPLYALESPEEDDFPPIMLRMQVNNKPLEVELDCGSKCTVFSISEFKVREYEWHFANKCSFPKF